MNARYLNSNEHSFDSIPRGHETILMVDDEDSIRSLVRIVLESYGYTVLEAESGEAAIEIVQSHSAAIDLLIVDIMLPGRRGKDLLDELLALQPGMHVLQISGYTEDRLAPSDRGPASVAFLQKPFFCDVLARMVRAQLDS